MNRHQAHDLAQMQAVPLEGKIAMTKQRADNGMTTGKAKFMFLSPAVKIARY